MFGVLFFKEIYGAIQTKQFLIVVFLCLTLIPLGMYVSVKSYEQRLANFRQADQLYQNRSEGKVGYFFKAEGYRPPSWMSVFATGIEPFFPSKVITSPDGNYTFLNDTRIPNPQSLLFGKIDFLFIVGFVLSLLALIFTFNTISGEKESATLRLILSNSVSRGMILLAKAFGNFSVFLAPFLVSVVLGLFILSLRGSIPLFTGESLWAVFLIVLSALLFIASMFSLGVSVSSRTTRSMTSMVVMLLIWVGIVLAIPKLSPMVAEIIYPIPSPQIFQMGREITRENMEKQLDTERRKLFEKKLNIYGVNNGSVHSNPDERASHQIREIVESPNDESVRSNPDERSKKAHDEYDQDVVPLERQYKEQITETLARLDKDYQIKQARQQNIAVNLSRLSPLCCFTYIVTEFSSTGLRELRNFEECAGRFQNRLQMEVYNKFVMKQYGTLSGGTAKYVNEVPGFNPSKTPVPHLSEYRHVSVSEVLKTVWIDFLILAMYTVLFFAGAFVSFLRYDVR